MHCTARLFGFVSCCLDLFYWSMHPHLSDLFIICQSICIYACTYRKENTCTLLWEVFMRTMYFLPSKVVHSWFIAIAINCYCYCYHIVGPSFNLSSYIYSLTTLINTVYLYILWAAVLPIPSPNIYRSHFGEPVPSDSSSCLAELEPWWGHCSPSASSLCCCPAASPMHSEMLSSSSWL